MSEKNLSRDQLQEIADKSNTTVKNIYQLVTKWMIDDAHYLEKVNAMRNQEIQTKQLELMRMQTLNEGIQNQLLSFTLKRKLKIRKFFGLIKTPKT